jgi:uncharacterized protein (TIGR02117 family)
MARHRLEMKRLTLLALLMVAACLATGCSSPVRGLFPAPSGQTPRTVYVLHDGLHTGVIVRAVDIPTGLWPERSEFPDAEYLETGGGDSQGYRFPLTSRIVLRAMFASKASVLFIHAFSGSITNEYAGMAKEIIAVQLSTRGFARLCAYVQGTYVLDPSGRPIAMPAFYPEENYFLAHGHYSAINNCNNWTARALRAAGCPISPRWSVLPGIVICQSRRFGRVIWPEAQSKKTYRNIVPTRGPHLLLPKAYIQR